MIEYFSTLSGMAALSVLVSEAIIKSCKVSKKWVKQLISWLVPILASCFGLLCQLGLFAAFGPVTAWTAWVYTILTGAGIGLISNGIYEIDAVQLLLDTVIEWLKKLFNRKTVSVETTDESDNSEE